MQDNQTYQRMQPIINMIDKSIVCDSVSTNADGSFTLLTSRTKWAMVGFDISILVTTYRITAVVYNESITVTGAILPAVLTFDLFAPIFKHGTIRVVASELNKVADFRNRLPLIYLKEQTVERLHFDKLDAIDSENDVTLYFLGAADNANWNQEDGDTKGILPMRSLANEFIKVVWSNVPSYIWKLIFLFVAPWYILTLLLVALSILNSPPVGFCRVKYPVVISPTPVFMQIKELVLG